MNLNMQDLSSFDLNPTALILALIFGVIGYAYYSYGKKHSTYFLISGIVLMVFPYFVSSTFWTATIGAVWMIIPFFLPKKN